MAGILHANSIIADSTASSSSPPRPPPDHVADSSASTLLGPPIKVKRVGRTYGRPKPNLDMGDVARDDPSSRARILRTAPRDADDQVIPASDDAEERDTNFAGYDWRNKLKEIDEDYDASGEKTGPQSVANASTTKNHDASTTRQDVSALFQISSESPISSLSHLSIAGPDEQTTRSAPTEVAGTDTLFDGSLSSLLSSGPTVASSPFSGRAPSAANDELEESAPFSEHSPSHKHVVKSPEVSDSDNASPQHPYPINSPIQRSSPTPPTSPLAGEFSLQDATVSGAESAGSAIESGTNSRETKKGKARAKGKVRERCTKGPTKKEVQEIRKESARLLADRHVSIRRTQAHSTRTIASLFNKLKQAPTVTRQDSDPITSFSSPGNVFHAAGNASSSDDSSPVKPGYLVASAASPKPKETPGHHSLHIPSPGNHNVNHGDEDMPEPDAILLDDEEKRLKQIREQNERAEAERRAKNLEERKRKALEISRLHSGAGTVLSKAGAGPTENSDTDDDLEFVEHMVRVPRAPLTRGDKDAKPFIGAEGKDTNPLIGGRAQTIFRSRGGERSTPSASHTVSQRSLEVAARPTFMTKKNQKRKGGQDNSVSHKDLNSLILQRADKQSGAIEEKKEEQWVKAGGTLKDQRRANAEEKSVTDWLQKGSTREDAMEVDEEDEDEDGEDPEYTPEGVEHHETDESEGESEEAGAPDDKPVLEQRMDISDDDADADKENHRPAPRRQTARAIVDSDEEDETAGRSNLRRPVVLAPDTSFTEEDELDSPGEDKENSAQLAFDFSDDKENASVPRHRPRGRLLGADEQGGDELWPTSPPPVSQAGGAKTSRAPLGRLDAEGESAFMPPPLAQRRDVSQGRVLQVLHEEDKDATLAPAASVRKGGLLRRSSSPSLPTSDDENVEGPKAISTEGFSQLFMGDNGAEVEEPDPGSALGEGGFSQFFSQGNPEGDIFSELPLQGKARTLFAQRQSPSEPEARQDGFEFTQPNALLPSVRISESERREVEDMFGKDQEFKLDEAKRLREEAQAEVGSVSGNLNFGFFVPSQPTQLSPQSIRHPLETLSLGSGGADTQLDKIPRIQPSRRGRLLRERPQGRQTSSTPSPPRRNAFDVLRDAAANGKGRELPPKPILEKSDFIEAEAQESDEEAMLGFGGTKGDDDEEIGDDDPDAIVEGLVDDAMMDDKAQAADRVLEKHMEHQAADDAALEKMHQDAVDGKLRGKRRDRGVGFEDSDSDEDEFRGPRKPLYKKRRVEGDKLDAYGENPETRPFYNAYQADLAEEDDLTLAYLRQQDSGTLQEERDDASGDEEPMETIDYAEIKQRFHEIKEGQLPVRPELDPDSVDWLHSSDQEMEDGNVQVKDGPLHPYKVGTGSHSTLDHVDYRGLFKGKKTDTSEQGQLKMWASQEARAHASASGRGGFSRREDGSNQSRKQGRVVTTMTKGSNSSGEARAVKSSSLMSRVEKRKGFDSQP